MAEQIYHLDPDATGLNDGSSYADAFQSVASMNAVAYDLQSAGDTLTLNCKSSAGTAVGQLTFSATWNVGASNFITINIDDVIGASFDATKFRISMADPGTTGMAILPAYTTVNGVLQLESTYTGTSGRYGLVLDAVNIKINRLILKGDPAASSSAALRVSSLAEGCEVNDFVVYGWAAGIDPLGGPSTGVANRFQNGTVYNCVTGARLQADYKTLPVYNNLLIIGCTDPWDTTASRAYSGSNNASYGIAPPYDSAGGVTLTSNTITDYLTSTADFSLNPSATYVAEIDSTGLDLSAYFTTDISGDTITSWSIGADSNASTADTTAPTFTAQSFNYAENQSSGATVATLSASDDTAVTSFIFTATGTQTSSDTFFNIDNAGIITITAAGVAGVYNDFETGSNSVVHNVTAGDAALNTTAADITLNVTNVDDTAPSLSVTTKSFTNVAATVGCTTDEAGTAYMCMYLTSEGTPPTDSEVVLGTYTNAVGQQTGLAVSAGAFTFTEITGLTGNTGYSFKIIVIDAATNQSSAITDSFTTQSATATISTDAVSSTLDVVLFDSAIVGSGMTILKEFNDVTTDVSGSLVLDLNDVAVTDTQAVEGIGKDTTSGDPIPLQGVVSFV